MVRKPYGHVRNNPVINSTWIIGRIAAGSTVETLKELYEPEEVDKVLKLISLIEGEKKYTYAEMSEITGFTYWHCRGMVRKYKTTQPEVY